MFEVVYSHIRSIDIVNENYLTNNHEPNKIIFSFSSYSLRIRALRRRKHLYQTASSIQRPRCQWQGTDMGFWYVESNQRRLHRSVFHTR